MQPSNIKYYHIVSNHLILVKLQHNQFFGLYWMDVLWGSVGEKCCREVAEKCVVGKCWRRIVVGKSCRDVL